MAQAAAVSLAPFFASRRRATRAAAAAPNSNIIGGAGTSVPPVDDGGLYPPLDPLEPVLELVLLDVDVLLPPKLEELVDELVETFPLDEEEVELDTSPLDEEVEETLPDEVDVELPPVEVDVELPPVDVELPPVDVELPPVDVELPPVDVELPPVELVEETLPLEVELDTPLDVETLPDEVETPLDVEVDPPVEVEEMIMFPPEPLLPLPPLLAPKKPPAKKPPEKPPLVLLPPIRTGTRPPLVPLLAKLGSGACGGIGGGAKGIGAAWA